MTTTSANKPPKHELVDLVIEEGSAVDAGDNPPAKIALLKNKGGEGAADAGAAPGEPAATEGFIAKLKRWAGVKVSKEYGMNPARTTGQILAMEEFRDKFWKLRMAFVESMNSILGSCPPDEVGSMMATSVAEFTARANELAGAMKPEKRAEITTIITEMTDALQDRATVKRAQLAAAVERLEEFDFGPPASAEMPADDTTNKDKENTMSTTTNKSAGIDAILSKLSAEDRATLDAHIKAATPPAPAPAAKAADPVLADAPPAVIKRMEEMEARMAKMLADQQEATLTAKASSFNVGMDVEVVKEMLRTAEKVGKLEETEKRLRGIEAQIRKNSVLTARLGAAGKRDEATPAIKSADAAVWAKADALRKQDPTLTRERAYAKVLASEPMLATAAIHGFVAHDA